MMACSLAGLSTSRSIRPVATTYYRFFSLKLEDKCKPEVRDLFKKANCPRLCATTNLARLLNLMDNRIGVTPAACPRWDVIEDDKALYIIRDLSGLPRKDPVEGTGLNECRFGCVRVWPRLDDMHFGVELGIPAPGPPGPRYFIEISTPETIFHSPREDIVMDVKGDVLKVTIPKKKGKWTGNRITTNAWFGALHNKG